MWKRLQNIRIKRNLLLECPICHSALPITKEQLGKTTTKCKACRNYFDYSQQLTAAGLPLPNNEKSDFYPIRKGLDMRKLEDRLEIELRAKDLSKSDPIGKIFFAYFGVFFLGYSYFQKSGFDAFIVSLMMIPFLYLGIKYLYQGLLLWYNVTNITVNKEMISVEHAPINFLAFKDRHLMVDAIDQLAIQKYEVDANFENQNGQGTAVKYDWKVTIKMKDGEVIDLINGLSYEEDAQLIEQQIEKYLGIQEELELKKISIREKVNIPMPNSNENKK